MNPESSPASRALDTNHRVLQNAIRIKPARIDRASVFSNRGALFGNHDVGSHFSGHAVSSRYII